MQYKYSNALLNTCETDGNILQDAENVLLVCSTEQLNRLKLQPSLLTAVTKALEDNKTQVFTILGNKRSFLVTTPRRNVEVLRLARALISKNLKRRQSKSAKFKGLKQFAEAECYALLEGLLLSSYEFVKYKKEKIQDDKIITYLPGTVLSADRLAELKVLVEAVSLTKTLFLKHFTDYPWLHLDIAGAAFVKEAKGYRQSGATTVPVRLVYEFAKRRIKDD